MFLLFLSFSGHDEGLFLWDVSGTRSTTRTQAILAYPAIKNKVLRHPKACISRPPTIGLGNIVHSQQDIALPSTRSYSPYTGSEKRTHRKRGIGAALLLVIVKIGHDTGTDSYGLSNKQLVNVA